MTYPFPRQTRFHDIPVSTTCRSSKSKENFSQYNFGRAASSEEECKEENDGEQDDDEEDCFKGEFLAELALEDDDDEVVKGDNELTDGDADPPLQRRP